MKTEMRATSTQAAKTTAKAVKEKAEPRARHHRMPFKVSGCCERGNCQNCTARNCTHSCHLSGR